MDMNMAKLKKDLETASTDHMIQQVMRNMEDVRMHFNFCTSSDCDRSSYVVACDSFRVDLAKVCSAAESIWTITNGSVPYAYAEYGWPAKAAGALALGEMLHVDRDYDRCQSTEDVLEDEDVILQVLADAGLAQRLVELLLTSHDARPAHIPSEVYEHSLLTLNTSGSIQYFSCLVGPICV